MTSRWYRYVSARSAIDADLAGGRITDQEHRNARYQLRVRYDRRAI